MFRLRTSPTLQRLCYRSALPLCYPTSSRFNGTSASSQAVQTDISAAPKKRGRPRKPEGVVTVEPRPRRTKGLTIKAEREREKAKRQQENEKQAARLEEERVRKEQQRSAFDESIAAINNSSLVVEPSDDYARFPALPRMNEWRTYFPPAPVVVRDRVSIKNPLSSEAVAKSFIRNKLTKSRQPKVIIEAFPGPGSLSRALLTLPPTEVGKLIILEDYEPYLDFLRPLELADPRVKVIPLSGFSWSTYSTLDEMGLFEDMETVPWDGPIHPSLHFITHLPHNGAGEQFVAQLLRCIPEKSWLFKYGRIPMSFLLGDWVWRRISASPTDRERCKLSVIAEVAANCSLSLSSNSLLPYNDHFHPTRVNSGAHDRRPENRRLGHPLVGVNMVPLKEQLIDKGKLGQWDYVLRRLFVLKSTPLKNAMSSLAPGAESLFKRLTDPNLPPEQRVDIKKQVRSLTARDWALITNAFIEWPFAPENLTIDSFHGADDRRSI
ncbi:hypothetical protein EW146_g5377 [Bondarzewia mesenterica]|uniref:rRNA adenine N(6)-methyltransferase n=1 Tax=Bondarzewia mesenterica TaxID=1095465 RepID=A0A4S4LSR4_9AGAM|nr:hypothetical protein EW146_g5377 [Bondarzewia mesenterica]